jgi:hypothetical protein
VGGGGGDIGGGSGSGGDINSTKKMDSFWYIVSS